MNDRLGPVGTPHRAAQAVRRRGGGLVGAAEHPFADLFAGRILSFDGSAARRFCRE